MPLPETSFLCGAAADAEAPGVAEEHCRRWLNWAAAQVDACLADDKPACDQLLDSLAEMLGPARAASGGRPGDAATCQEMSALVIAVQSHDRVMQRLGHVAEALRRVQHHLADAGRARSPASWRLLRDGQLREFSMAEERALFVRLVVQEGEGAPAGEAALPGDAGRQADLSTEDTIELFVADGGLGRP
jgi:hypothetical protein